MNNYILQIDTATEICSVSIGLNGEVLGRIDASEPNLHASKLTVFIDQLLEELNLHYRDLVAVAVSMGPGSYTGLRIGVSTAKGLCYALDIPLIGIDTLASIMQGYIFNRELDVAGLYIPMLDARRMEVYMAIYDANVELIVPTQARVIDIDSFKEYEGKQIYLFGSGAAKLADTFDGNNNIHIDLNYQHSSAWLTKAAHERFGKSEFEDLVYFEPFYLKEFVATMPKKLV